MTINDQCQSCRRRPRTNAKYVWSGNPDIWLLCNDCVVPSSKYSIENGAKTVQYDLTDTYLRDIEHKNKAFIFRLICSDRTLGNRYIFLPILHRGHNCVTVWDIDLNKEANGWWDWPIIFLGEVGKDLICLSA